MKIEVKCLETSKKQSFLEGKEYKGVTFSDTHYRLIGEDGKPHLMKKERFTVITIK